MTTRALVTGATGMLGAYVVERLLLDGWRVRGLVRSARGRQSVEALGAEAVPGDVTDLDSMRAAAAGCDALFHTAAAIGPGSDWEAFRVGNVVGTERVVSAAEAAGSRLVHVSSTSVFGRHRYHAAATDETTPLPRLPARDAYGRSKQEAERVVLDAHAAGRVWATIVRPPMMYGKRDRQFAPRVGPALRRGLFPLIGGGRTTMSLVHAHAVADGAVRAALTDGAGGRVYHLTNDFDVTGTELVDYASRGLRRPVRALHLPLGGARLMCSALSLALVVGGRRDLAAHTAGMLDGLTRDNPFTSERARRELQWAPTIRPSEGLPEAFRWWSEHGGARRGPVAPS